MIGRETAIALLKQAGACWNKGYPPHPYDSEWFIAKTIHKEKVVLRRLPEEYSYDFKTADETYMKKENVIAWMQFPDSEFIAFTNPPEADKLLQQALEAVLDEHLPGFTEDAPRQHDDVIYDKAIEDAADAIQQLIARIYQEGKK